MIDIRSLSAVSKGIGRRAFVSRVKGGRFRGLLAGVCGGGIGQGFSKPPSSTQDVQAGGGYLLVS